MNVDLRFVIAALALLGAGALYSAFRGTDTALSWSLPFALILLFLAAAGPSPAGRVLHLTSDEPLR